MALLACASILVAAADPAAAQECAPTGACAAAFRGAAGDDRAAPYRGDLAGNLTALSINAALGGVTGGIRRYLGGGSFWRGLTEGAAGGTAIYAGKLLSAESYWGAGLVGRQVAAVGASVVRNTSDGRAPLAELMLPVGPVRAYLDRDRYPAVRFKLDLPGAAVSAYRILAVESRFDGAASLSAGTPVFYTDSAPKVGWRGNNTAGVILLLARTEASPPPSLERQRIFAHERVHLLQYDQAQHTWSAPVEAWLLRRLPGGAWIERHLDLGLVMVPLVLLNHFIPYDERPWEQEAHFFSGDRQAH